MEIPFIQDRGLGKSLHGLTIRSTNSESQPAAGFILETIVSSGYNRAGRQSFEIPFPGSWVGLIEVVDIEHQVPFRRGKDTKVSQVGIPHKSTF